MQKLRRCYRRGFRGPGGSEESEELAAPFQKSGDDDCVLNQRSANCLVDLWLRGHGGKYSVLLGCSSVPGQIEIVKYCSSGCPLAKVVAGAGTLARIFVRSRTAEMPERKVLPGFDLRPAS
jgi:hypothetical protein